MSTQFIIITVILMKSSRYNFFNCFMICIALQQQQQQNSPLFMGSVAGPGPQCSASWNGNAVDQICYTAAIFVCVCLCSLHCTHRKLLDILLTDAEHVLVFFRWYPKPDFTYEFSITAYTTRIPFKPFTKSMV